MTWSCNLDLPITLPSAFLFHFLRVSVDVTGLGEVAREVIFRNRGAVSEGTVVTVVLFVGACH